MKHSHKLLLNTIVSYLKIIINAGVTVFATKIALQCLGADDYGLFNLIAGIIAMLAFLNGALMISAQRFFSIAIGAKDEGRLTDYFNGSLGIHIAVATLMAVVLFAAKPLLFAYVLNINPESIETGKAVYDLMILSSVITIGTIPYSAIMNAREDLAQLSFIEILSCIMKLFAAVVLLFAKGNLLEIYTIFMMLAVLFKMLLEIGYSRWKYKEAKLRPKRLFKKDIIREMLGFVGWNTLGALAVLVRNQGVAVVLNVFFGTVVNAAYGIANQVNALVLSFASSLTAVFTPTIIQAKGAGNDDKMIFSALFSSKVSFLFSSLMALPILVYTPEILNVWLSEYPDNTIGFCRAIVISFLVLQLYPGINRAIYASGKIKGYQISISIILISIIPIGTILFKCGHPAVNIIILMIILQAFTLFSTTHYAHKLCRLNLRHTYFQYILPAVVAYVVNVFICIFLKNNSDGNIWLYTLTILLVAVIYIALYEIHILQIRTRTIVKFFQNIQKIV